jgi:hypothetical protein
MMVGSVYRTPAEGSEVLSIEDFITQVLKDKSSEEFLELLRHVVSENASAFRDGATVMRQELLLLLVVASHQRIMARLDALERHVTGQGD